jgi:hypothetical protein
MKGPNFWALNSKQRTEVGYVRCEVLKAVTVKNGVFWDVRPCGSYKNQCFGGTCRLHHRGDNNWEASSNVSSNYCVLVRFEVSRR